MVNKWWRPKDEEQRTLFEEAKYDIKTFLTVTPTLLASKAYHVLAEHMDGAIKFREMGFVSFGAFLFHCDDIINLTTDGRNYYLSLRGPADEGAAHIKDLVENQKKDQKGGAQSRNKRTLSSNILLTIPFDIGLLPDGRKSEEPKVMFSPQSSTPRPTSSISMSQGQNYSHQTPGRGRYWKQHSRNTKGNGESSSVTEYAYEERGPMSRRPFVKNNDHTNSDPYDMKSMKSHLGQLPTESRRQEYQKQDSMNKTAMKQYDGPKIHSSVEKSELLPPECKFEGRLLGTDEYGHVYVQFNEPKMNEAFEQLNNSLRDSYAQDFVKSKHRIQPGEFSVGFPIVARVDRAFVRAKIFEVDEENGFCVCHQIDHGSFILVQCTNIYHMKDELKNLPPRAFMCMLEGTESCMYSAAIGHAMANASAFPEVKVTVINPKHSLFKVPVVTLYTVRSNHDILYLMRRYGGLNYSISKTDYRLSLPQQSVAKELEKKCYF